MRKNYILPIILLHLIIVMPLSGKMNKVQLGTGDISGRTLEFGGVVYPLYHYLDTDYIPILYCETMGCDIKIEEDKLSIEMMQCIQEAVSREVNFSSMIAYTCDKEIYIGGIHTYAICVGGQILVPVKVLQSLWDVVLCDNQYNLSYKLYYNKSYVSMNKNRIENLSEYVMSITYQDIYWKQGKYYTRTYDNVLLEPREVRARTLDFKDEKQTYTYLTTIILEANGITIQELCNEMYGQKNTALLKQYDRCVRLKALDQIFKPYIVKAKMKYNTRTLKEKEVVELWRSEKNEYFVVKDKFQKHIQVPQDSIEGIQDLGGTYTQASKEQIEEYVNLKGLTSDTGYLIWTDIYRQRTYVLKGSKENWKLEKSFLSSTGVNTRLTPRGFYKLNYRIPYFGVEKGFRCKNAVVIFRDYMYHSILFDASGNYVKEGLYQLGQRVSHGCIRLSEEDSWWLYNKVPLNTTVWIN